MPLFANVGAASLERGVSEKKAAGIIPTSLVAGLPERLRRAVDEAVSLFLFFEKKPGVNHAPAFTALLGVLDETARGLVVQRLSNGLPTATRDQAAWFEPYLAKVDPRMHRHYAELARNLRKTLVYQSGVSPLGLLRSCLDYALNDATQLTGVFAAVREAFRKTGGRALLELVQSVNEFRKHAGGASGETVERRRRGQDSAPALGPGTRGAVGGTHAGE